MQLVSFLIVFGFIRCVSATLLRGIVNDCFPCRMARPHVLWLHDDDDDGKNQRHAEVGVPPFQCHTQGLGHEDIVELPTEWLSTVTLQEGQDVCFDGAHVKDGRLVLARDTNSSTLVLNDNRHRRVQWKVDNSVRSGSYKLLGVHVSTLTDQPDVSLEDMQMAIFGTGGGKPRNGSVPVVDQIRAISKDLLRYEEATGDNIQQGMLTVQLDQESVAKKSVFEVITLTLKMTAAKVGGSIDKVAHRVVFCLPNDTLKDGSYWRAFTYLHGPYSYYNRATCSLLNILVHELGHGLGFQHSANADGTNIYGDLSDYMGGSPKTLMAFNGHKHWISNWFGNGAVQVYPQNKILTVRLHGFVTFSHSDLPLDSDQAVILRVGNLYIQYNQATCYNTDVLLPNTVTISKASTDRGLSYAMAALSEGENFVYMDYDSSDNALIVEVCSIDKKYAVVRLYRSVIGLQFACASYIPTPTVTNALLGFSSQNTVQVRDVGLKYMNGLHIGDSILADESGAFSQVYSFGLQSPNTEAYFLQIHTEGNMSIPLEVTTDQLLYLYNNVSIPTTTMILAGDIKIGDRLLMIHGLSSPVKWIRSVIRRGVYAPFTDTGYIVVNGFVLSSYVAMPSAVKLPLDQQHWMQHNAYLQYHSYCEVLDCKAESYNVATTSIHMGFSAAVAMWMPIFYPREHISVSTSTIYDPPCAVPVADTLMPTHLQSRGSISAHFADMIRRNPLLTSAVVLAATAILVFTLVRCCCYACFCSRTRKQDDKAQET